MARLTLDPTFSAISGKSCAVAKTYYRTNTQTGKSYVIERHKDYVDPNTEDQQEVRTAFANKSKLAATWYAANKPTTSTPDGTEAYQKVLTAYKAQHKIGNIFAFIRSKIQSDGTLSIGNTTTTTPSSSDQSDTGGSEIPDLETN